MKTQEKEANIKINLSVPPEFAELLTVKAHKEYMPLATFIKSYLMKNLLGTGDKENLNTDENGKS